MQQSKRMERLADAEALWAFLGLCESPDTVRCVELINIQTTAGATVVFQKKSVPTHLPHLPYMDTTTWWCLGRKGYGRVSFIFPF